MNEEPAVKVYAARRFKAQMDKRIQQPQVYELKNQEFPLRKFLTREEGMSLLRKHYGNEKPLIDIMETVRKEKQITLANGDVLYVSHWK